MKAPSDLIFSIASEPWQFEQIHELNYQMFVEEIPQHAPNPQGRLVDRFHAENVYVIALNGRKLVGMLALRHQRPFSLDSKVPHLDAHLPAGRKPIELRLVAIVPEFRKTAVFAALFEHAVRYSADAGYDIALVSATPRQLKLYRHLGCTPFGPLVGTVGAQYQPMYLTLEAFGQTVEKQETHFPPNVSPLTSSEGEEGIHAATSFVSFETPAALKTYHKASTQEVLQQAKALAQFSHTFKISARAVLMTAEHLYETHIQSTAEISRVEADDLFRVRGLQQADRLLRESGESLTSEAVATRLGISRQAINEKKKRGVLLSFAIPSGRGDRFPLWQFQGQSVRSWVQPLIQRTGNGFDALAFLLARRTSLGGRRYLDHALSEDEAVIKEMLERASSGAPQSEGMTKEIFESTSSGAPRA